MHALSISSYQYATLKERILLVDPDLDHDTLADTLEGATTLHDVVAIAVRLTMLDESRAEAVHQYIKDLKARAERIEARATKRREALRDALVDAGLSKMIGADFTLSIRSGTPGVVVTDPDKIPSPYWQPRDPTLDKLAVGADLRRGVTVPGAELSNAAPVLAIRVR